MAAKAMPEKWTNPLVTPDRIAFYASGEGEEIVFEKKVPLADQDGSRNFRTESISRRFLLALVDKAMASPNCLELVGLAQRQIDEVLAGTIPQPSFDEDLFFGFTEELAKIEPKLTDADLAHSTSDIALIVFYLISRKSKQ